MEMTHLVVCTIVAWLACFYWIASLLVLLLRISEPKFGNMARYGNRCEAARMVDGPQCTRNRSFHPHSTQNLPSCSVVKSHCWRWLWGKITAAVEALDRTAVCRLRVDRRYSFCAFYTTGIVFSLLLLLLPRLEPISDCSVNDKPANISASAADIDIDGGSGGGFFVNLSGWGSLWLYDSLPLCAFLIHCAVRLWECLYLHCFRGGPQDSVTLFATLAGCSFYLFASISSSSSAVLHMVRMTLVCHKEMIGVGEWLEIPHYRFPPPAKTSLPLLLLHLILQGLQVFHHRILAKLRGGSSAWVASSKKACVEGRENVSGDAKGISNADSDTSYHFPYTHLFTYILEPHYTCEIMMYAVNAVSIWSVISRGMPPLGVLFTECIRGGVEVGGGEKVYCMLLLLLLAVASYMAPLGVLLFSLFNLSITASEHRHFWVCLNMQRERREQLPSWNLFYRIW